MTTDTTDSRAATPPRTLNEFRAFWRLSRSKWYVLKAKGLTPDVVMVGHSVLILPDAERQWIERMKAASAGASTGDELANTRACAKEIKS